MAVVGCSNPGCGSMAVGRGKCPDLATLECIGQQLMSCSNCREARYCSKTCQTDHWNGGHQSECTISKAFKQFAALLTNDIHYNKLLATCAHEATPEFPENSRRLVHFDFLSQKDVEAACDKNRLMRGEVVEVDIQYHSLRQLQAVFSDADDENWHWRCAMEACRDYSLGTECAVVITMDTDHGVLIKPFVVKLLSLQ